MDLPPLDPDDRFRGRPPDGGRKVMNVSFAKDVYDGIMKVREGSRSSFISDFLRIITRQFDPGPSSYLALELKRLIDEAIAKSRKENNYEKMAAVSSLANEVVPKLEPYLDLCKEEGPEEKASDKMPAVAEIGTIMEGIRAGHALERLGALLDDAKTIHGAVPSLFRDDQYKKQVEQTRMASTAVSKLLAAYRNYITTEDDIGERKGKQEIQCIRGTRGVPDFRRGLPMGDTVNGCARLSEDAKEISDEKVRAFVMETCSFVDRSVRRSWGSGIDLVLHACERVGGYLVLGVFNRGYYGVLVSGARCDGEEDVSISGRKEPYYLPPLALSEVGIVPCSMAYPAARHTVTLVIGYLDFSFEIRDEKVQHI